LSFNTVLVVVYECGTTLEVKQSRDLVEINGVTDPGGGSREDIGLYYRIR